MSQVPLSNTTPTYISETDIIAKHGLYTRPPNAPSSHRHIPTNVLVT
jgi:hypothetical protein